MAQFHSIHSNIWEDDKFRRLSGSSKLLYVYSFSNHRCPISGIYKLSPESMAFDTGIHPDCKAELRELIEIGLIAYDFARNVIWVRGKIKHDKSWTTKMRMKSIKSNLSEFSKCSFMTIVFEQYPFLADLAIEAEQERNRFQGCGEKEVAPALEAEEALEIEKDES